MIQKDMKEIISMTLLLYFLSFSLLFSIDWQAKTPMPNARSFLGGAEFENKIFAFGGRNNSGQFDTLEIYDVTSNTWSVGSTMPIAMSEFGVGVVNSKIYVIGGFDSVNVLASVYEYDPVANSWDVKSPMPTAREGLAIAVANDRIYAIGGDDGTNILADVEEYNPANDTWTIKAPMPTQRNYLTARNVAGKIYAIGGCISDVTPCGTVEEYDPVGNNWASKTDMPTARYGLASGVVDNRIYALGGFAVPTIFATVESYDPGLNIWNNETLMLTARWGLTAETVTNKLYAIGGQTLFHGGWTNINEEGIILIGIEEDNAGLSNPTVQLHAQPNPFSTITKISLDNVQNTESKELKIYDATGRLIKDFSRSTPYALRNTQIIWDRTDNSNQKLPAGIYMLELKTEEQRLTKKLVVFP